MLLFILMYVKIWGCLRKQWIKNTCQNEKTPYLCTVEKTKTQVKVFRITGKKNTAQCRIKKER